MPLRLSPPPAQRTLTIPSPADLFVDKNKPRPELTLPDPGYWNQRDWLTGRPKTRATSEKKLNKSIQDHKIRVYEQERILGRRMTQGEYEAFAEAEAVEQDNVDSLYKQAKKEIEKNIPQQTKFSERTTSLDLPIAQPIETQQPQDPTKEDKQSSGEQYPRARVPRQTENSNVTQVSSLVRPAEEQALLQENVDDGAACEEDYKHFQNGEMTLDQYTKCFMGYAERKRVRQETLIKLAEQRGDDEAISEYKKLPDAYAKNCPWGCHARGLPEGSLGHCDPTKDKQSPGEEHLAQPIETQPPQDHTKEDELERTQASAITYKGKVYSGERHFDVIKQIAEEHNIDPHQVIDEVGEDEISWAFVTNKGNVIDRAEMFRLGWVPDTRSDYIPLTEQDNSVPFRSRRTWQQQNLQPEQLQSHQHESRGEMTVEERVLSQETAEDNDIGVARMMEKSNGEFSLDHFMQRQRERTNKLVEMALQRGDEGAAAKYEKNLAYRTDIFYRQYRSMASEGLLGHCDPTKNKPYPGGDHDKSNEPTVSLERSAEEIALLREHEADLANYAAELQHLEGTTDQIAAFRSSRGDRIDSRRNQLIALATQRGDQSAIDEYVNLANPAKACPGGCCEQGLPIGSLGHCDPDKDPQPPGERHLQPQAPRQTENSSVATQDKLELPPIWMEQAPQPEQPTEEIRQERARAHRERIFSHYGQQQEQTTQLLDRENEPLILPITAEETNLIAAIRTEDRARSTGRTPGYECPGDCNLEGLQQGSHGHCSGNRINYGNTLGGGMSL